MALHGEALDRPSYSFLQTINEGNNSVCVLYRHEVFDKLVVQKTISLLGVPDGLARSEPRLLEGMRHDNLVEVREAQFDSDWNPSLMPVTFVTDYYPGKSIHGAMAEGYVFSVGQALAIAEGILAALHYLHVDRRTIHRDVKPGNVMLDMTRTHAYLGDLGSAAPLPQNETSVAAAAGTLLYRPPEYASGRIGIAADLYSTGLTLFEMLNGPFPYAQLKGDVLERRAEDGKRALTDRQLDMQPWVPQTVATFTRKLLSKSPGDRFASADEALRALKRLKFVDWKSDLNRTAAWEGKYPPGEKRSRQRLFRITIDPIGSGKYKGQFLLQAAQRTPTTQWRNYASLSTRVIDPSTRAVAAFFRTVEARAHSSPAL